MKVLSTPYTNFIRIMYNNKKEKKDLKKIKIMNLRLYSAISLLRADPAIVTGWRCGPVHSH